MVDIKKLTERFDCVLFDLGNTLIGQANPGTPYNELGVYPLHNVIPLLDALKGKVRMGIVSNTSNISGEMIKEKIGDLGNYFEVVIASYDVGAPKPDPKPILVAVEQMGVNPARTLYIGDTETDEIAAHAAGLSFTYTSGDIAMSLQNYLESDTALARALQSTINYSESDYITVLKEFDALAKPAGSLGRLEKYIAQIAGITHSINPTVDPAGIAIFAGDHGIAADDSVTPWPQMITGAMTEVMGSGKAAVSVFAGVADVYTEIVNVGMIADAKSPLVRNHAVKQGTADIRTEDAMTREEALAAMEVGAVTAERMIAGGSRFLATGEVGIGNTTPSAALISYFSKTPAEKVTGRGSGIDDETYARKIKIVEQITKRVEPNTDPIDVLAKIGGLEIAALAGFILRAASLKTPVLLDGVITLAAATVAHAIKPELAPILIAGHCSSEPGSQVALDHLKLDAVLTLDLRLGEGTGAMLALPILRAGCAAREKMARIADIV